jgi:hypothetical protein
MAIMGRKAKPRRRKLLAQAIIAAAVRLYNVKMMKGQAHR